MFNDPQFWVAIAFIIFIAAIFKPVGKVLCSALDARSAKIQKELDEAVRLKDEAQALLASYQRKQKESVIEAEKIVANAESEAKRIVVEAEKSLEENLNKKIQVAMQKIASYENSVMQDVRVNSIEVAIATMRTLIQEKLNGEVADRLVSTAIGEMGKKLS